MQVEVVSDHNEDWEGWILVWLARTYKAFGYDELKRKLTTESLQLIQGVHFWITEFYSPQARPGHAPLDFWFSFELQAHPEDAHFVPQEEGNDVPTVTFLCRVER